MNVPQLTILKYRLIRASLILVCAAALLTPAAAQIKTRSLLGLPEAGPMADLDHCANGPLSGPVVCSDVTPNNNWVNGQLGSNKAHYREGESVPYRSVITGLTNGATYNLTIEYDTTKGGKAAFDYLTSYDRTENGTGFSAGQANPCGDVFAGCSPTAPDDAKPIPSPDSQVVPPNPPGQIPGQIDIWGGAITSVGFDGNLVGSLAGDSSRFIKVVFVAGPSGKAVLAWGAHIATRQNWGDNGSAIGITGSPYHVSLSAFTDANGNALGLGQQDHQLSVDAIYFPAQITIIKLVTDPGPPTVYSSTQAFPFTVTPSSVSTGFSLIDSDATQLGGASQVVQTTSFDTDIVITESNVDGWSLLGVTCGPIDNGGNSLIGTTMPSSANRNVTINLKEGNRVTCTFSNSKLRPTAAPATIGGRVVDSFGNGISKAYISVIDAETGSSHAVLTNPFGYYSMEGLDSGRFYLMTVAAKGFKFADNLKSFTLNDNLTDLDFVANP